MEYREIGGIKTSLLGMGNMRLPVKGRVKKSIDRAKAQEIIDYAMDHGVNYYDTAYVYHAGESEDFLGEALSKYPRDSYLLATKYFMMATANYEKVFEKQLRKLRTDHIDFYLIHNVMNATGGRYLKSGAIEYFLEQQRLGRIGKLGFSNHSSVATLERFLSHHQWDFVQLQINFRDWVRGTAKGEYEAACAHGVPVVVMEPLRGGKLLKDGKLAQEAGAGNNGEGMVIPADSLLHEAHPDWTLVDWAFRWLKTLDNVKCILSGMGTLGQIEQNVGIFSDDIALSASDSALLLQTISNNDDGTVPCTGCGYCIEGASCPSSIDIPYWMDVFNAQTLGQKSPARDAWDARQERVRVESDGVAEVDEAEATEEIEGMHDGAPGDCIRCNRCVQVCPQSIAIPDTLEKINN